MVSVTAGAGIETVGDELSAGGDVGTDDDEMSDGAGVEPAGKGDENNSLVSILL